MAELLPDPPRLTEAQRLWLLELGLDRPTLARLERGDSPGAAPEGYAGAPPGQAASASGAMVHGDADAAARGSGSPAGADAGTAAHENRSRALAALAALKQGAGERGTSASGAEAAKPARGLPPRDAAVATALGPDLAPAPDAPTPNVAPAMDVPAPRTTVQGAPNAPGGPAEWGALEARIQACEACGLHAGRRAAVPGAGATESVDWLVLGEAPGGRDDGLGQPFQGKAGDLLHAMLAAAGIEPGRNVFYTNLVKCRPRSNRPPTAEEIASCLPHLHRQMALLRPRGILVLGRLAAQALLGESASFEQYRGRVHAVQSGGRDIPVVVTYHPASLLSRPRHKAASWRDLNLARTLF